MQSTKSHPSAGKSKKPCGCGCGGKGTSSGTPCSCGCSTATCFERPRFFPGQLLSDTDLSAEQKYLREKQKLYHRTLHGHGVVCGLRLSCDAGCCGHVRVGDGFAIDECGNDIIVCNPYSFDAIEMLKENGWLAPTGHFRTQSRGREGQHEDCDERKEHCCEIPQCFYVVICYEEEECDFVTPFKTTCGPGAAACESTRVKETFKIELRQKPPETCDPISDLEARIECCWNVLREGQFFRSFSRYHRELLAISRGEIRELIAEQANPREIFCELQALFQHHLQRCPDLYDCTLPDRVCRLKWIHDSERDIDGGSLGQLCELVQQYMFECVLGEMTFSCCKPSAPCCVTLGSIEVEGGRLTRVRNCPREYVWSFNRFFDVAVATFVAQRACKPCDFERRHVRKEAVPVKAEGQQLQPAEHATRQTGFSFNQFMELFEVKPSWPQLAFGASAQAVRDFLESLKKAFDFTDPLAIPGQLFTGIQTPPPNIEIKKEHPFEEFAKSMLGHGPLASLKEKPQQPPADPPPPPETPPPETPRKRKGGSQ